MTQRADGTARVRHHSLSPEQFATLARGGGDQDAIEQLVAAQWSKHLILLGKVAELARRGDHPDDALGVSGYQLLAQVQRQNPAAAAEVIGYPSVGAWALHVIRSNVPPAAGPASAGPRSVASAALPDARPSGLAAVAAAAAIRAGLDAEIEVPVLGAGVLLPSLGAAEALGPTAVVAAREAEVRSGTRRVRLRPGEPGWRELRRVTAGSFAVVVDDLDPFRMPTPDCELTNRLVPSQVTEVRTALRAAWPLLSPASAAEIATAVRVIVPYQTPESGIHASTTSPQVFGTVAMSRQPDRYTCAETLVHETQHVKLGALLDLVALTRPDDGQRYYAPWRPDPRPASGLLQGTYAFLGVAGFWRGQREVAPEPAIRQRGHSEFARWRDDVAAAATTLLRSGQLTSSGETFVETMTGLLDEWRREPVPADALAVARRKSELHLAQWRADNGQPSTG